MLHYIHAVALFNTIIIAISIFHSMQGILKTQPPACGEECGHSQDHTGQEVKY